MMYERERIDVEACAVHATRKSHPVRTSWAHIAVLSTSGLLLIFFISQTFASLSLNLFIQQNLKPFVWDGSLDLLHHNTRSPVYFLNNRQRRVAYQMKEKTSTFPSVAIGEQENGTAQTTSENGHPAPSTDPFRLPVLNQSQRGGAPALPKDLETVTDPVLSTASDESTERMMGVGVGVTAAAENGGITEAVLPLWRARDWARERGRDEGGLRIRGTKAASKTAEAVRRQLQCLSRNGSWVYDPTPRKLPWNYWGGMNGPHLCEERWSGISRRAADDVVTRGGNWTVRETLKYKWVTNPCKFKTFDAKGFCRAVGPGRNVLMVGDSMTWQFYDSMRNYLLSTPQHRKHSGKFNCSAVACHRVCEDVLGKGQGFDIDWIRTDYLHLTDESVKIGVHQDNRWVQYIDELKPSIIIINRGAHYEVDEKYEESVRAAVAYLRAAYPDLLILFRNTVGGHYDCLKYERPVTERLRSDLSPRSYGWHEFPHQNEIAREIVEEFGGVYMDVEHMTALRPDGHRHDKDCLHYCQPGPLDWWVDLFYNILLALPR